MRSSAAAACASTSVRRPFSRQRGRRPSRAASFAERRTYASLLWRSATHTCCVVASGPSLCASERAPRAGAIASSTGNSLATGHDAIHGSAQCSVSSGSGTGPGRATAPGRATQTDGIQSMGHGSSDPSIDTSGRRAFPSRAPLCPPRPKRRSSPDSTRSRSVAEAGPPRPYAGDSTPSVGKLPRTWRTSATRSAPNTGRAAAHRSALSASICAALVARATHRRAASCDL